ncbi:MAG: transcriptional regulator [Candidatus Bathyarchaeota archaeon]|jgi:YHS domain-containing protein|nr:transcriptional regulator [Candidatus Bathyarchaeota archaeon]
MKTFVKCELCNIEISGEKCVFAVYKRVIDGEEHCFCCEHHADEFEREHGKQE